jgi:hypothetical protein
MRSLLTAALAGLGWIGLAASVLAEERDLADRLLAAYAKLGSYCARAQPSERAGERPFDSYGRVPASRMSASDLPPILQRALGWYWLAVAGRAGLRERFKAFEKNAELSTAALDAYEAPPGDPMAGQRVWIGREDGVIRRAARLDPLEALRGE